MDEFIRCISKLAVVSGIVVTVILFVVTGVLLLAPGVIFKTIYYVLILGCAAGTGYFFFCLVRMLIPFLREKYRNERNKL